MASADDFTPDERETAELVKALRSTGNLGPLLTLLQGSDGGPQRARDALLMLGELDLELLVQVALDTLIGDHVEDPALASQTRRVIRGDGVHHIEVTSRPARLRRPQASAVLPGTVWAVNASSGRPRRG